MRNHRRFSRCCGRLKILFLFHLTNVYNSIRSLQCLRFENLDIRGYSATHLLPFLDLPSLTQLKCCTISADAWPFETLTLLVSRSNCLIQTIIINLDEPEDRDFSSELIRCLEIAPNLTSLEIVDDGVESVLTESTLYHLNRSALRIVRSPCLVPAEAAQVVHTNRFLAAGNGSAPRHASVAIPNYGSWFLARSWRPYQ